MRFTCTSYLPFSYPLTLIHNVASTDWDFRVLFTPNILYNLAMPAVHKLSIHTFQHLTLSHNHMLNLSPSLCNLSAHRQVALALELCTNRRGLLFHFPPLTKGPRYPRVSVLRATPLDHCSSYSSVVRYNWGLVIWLPLLLLQCPTMPPSLVHCSDAPNKKAGFCLTTINLIEVVYRPLTQAANW